MRPPPLQIKLTSLTRLDLSANRIESLPKGLGNLTSLSALCVDRNHGLVPKALGEIQSTVELLAAVRNQSGGKGDGIDES